MPASKVKLHGTSEATEAQGMNLRQFLALIDPSDQNQVPVSSEAPFNITLDASVQRNYAGSAATKFVGRDTRFPADSENSWRLYQTYIAGVIAYSKYTLLCQFPYLAS